MTLSSQVSRAELLHALQEYQNDKRVKKKEFIFFKRYIGFIKKAPALADAFLNLRNLMFCTNKLIRFNQPYSFFIV